MLGSSLRCLESGDRGRGIIFESIFGVSVSAGADKLREYDRMEGVSVQFGVSPESIFGSFLSEQSARNGGTLQGSSE